MSNGTNPLANFLGISQQGAAVLSSIAQVVGFVSSVFGGVTVAISVLTDLGVLAQANVVVEIQQAINALWDDFQQALAALDLVGSMRDVFNQVASAQTQLENLTEFAPDDAATPGIKPVWDELRPFVLNNSLQAVNTLGGAAYWQRIFDAALVYNGPGSIPPLGTSPYGSEVWTTNGGVQIFTSAPAVDNGLVFDYRLTLPAYLEAISIRLTILVAVVADYLDTAQDELQKMSATLESYYLLIRDGSFQTITPLREAYGYNPTVSSPSVNFYYTWRGGGFTTLGPPNANWDNGFPTELYYGTVDPFSAYNSVRSWPADEFPLMGSSIGAPSSYQGEVASVGYPLASQQKEAQLLAFLVRYTVRSWVSWKEVYNGIGLGPVKAIIIHLKQLAGVSPATIAGPDENYSIRDFVNNWWGTGVIPDLNNEDGNLSMRKLLALLQTYNPEPYTSFRAAFAQ
jgi:hypothetical protein